MVSREEVTFLGEPCEPAMLISNQRFRALYPKTVMTSMHAEGDAPLTIWSRERARSFLDFISRVTVSINLDEQCLVRPVDRV